MKKRLVKKFGGTSVANIARLERAALTIKEAHDRGEHVAAVVSAMAGVTNQLVDYVKGLTAKTDTPEYDVVVSAGEQISAGLLAIALEQLGVSARSFLGWQVPISTTAHHGAAYIDVIHPGAIEDCWAQGVIPVVAGFQGISAQGRITTLGRGGSDTTAVGLAAFLQADRCDIYTDVDGVYTADPRLVPSATLLPHMTYDEMLAFADHGAKVLHAESVRIAHQYGVPVQVLSSFSNNPGTLITGPAAEIDHQSTQPIVKGITHKNDFCHLTLRPLRPVSAIQLQHFLHAQGIYHAHVGMQKDAQADQTHAILIDNQQFLSVSTALDRLQTTLPYRDMLVDTKVAKISLIGAGLRNASPLKTALDTLHSSRISATALLSETPTALSFSVPAHQSSQAVQILHAAFGLDQPQNSQQDHHHQQREKKSCA